MFRQRELYQKTVISGVLIIVINPLQQFLLSDCGGQPVSNRMDTCFQAGLSLIVYVNFGGWIISYQYHRQTGDFPGAAKVLYFLLYFLSDGLGNGFSINDPCHSDRTPSY